jgi:hypothetical protein
MAKEAKVATGKLYYILICTKKQEIQFGRVEEAGVTERVRNDRGEVQIEISMAYISTSMLGDLFCLIAESAMWI